jgi:hypothetical protein
VAFFLAISRDAITAVTLQTFHSLTVIDKLGGISTEAKPRQDAALLDVQGVPTPQVKPLTGRKSINCGMDAAAGLGTMP